MADDHNRLSADATSLSQLWYTRCPVPTPLGLAVQLGWFKDEFGPEGIVLNSLQESLDEKIKESTTTWPSPFARAAIFRPSGRKPMAVTPASSASIGPTNRC